MSTSTLQLNILEPLSVQMTAEEYKASLPKGKGGTKWSIDTYATYVNLLYPHISIPLDQEWKGTKEKLRHVCEKHDEYFAKPNTVLLEKTGCRCPSCKSDLCKAGGGITRVIRATPEEKEKAKRLRGEGLSYENIGKILGRPNSTILRWLCPKAAEKSRQYKAIWLSKNSERVKVTYSSYLQTPHGKAKSNHKSHLRRLLKMNVPEFVFINNQWCEVDREVTFEIWSDILMPKDEREAIERLCEQAARISNETGIQHEVDHIQPLSKGGEHLMYNLQIIPMKENREKNNTYRPQDQEFICKRLFDL